MSDTVTAPETRSKLAHSNAPFTVWPSMATALEPNLRWLVEHQAEIVAAWPARPMLKDRPLRVWPSGRVRIEFVHTWRSFAEARADCEKRIDRLIPKEPHA